MSFRIVFKKLVRKWNVFAANQAIKVIDNSRAQGKKERNMGQFEIHGTTVIVVSLEEDKRSVEHFAYVVEQILGKLCKSHGRPPWAKKERLFRCNSSQ